MQNCEIPTTKPVPRGRLYGLALVAILVLIVLFLEGDRLRGLAEEGYARIRTAGPVAFFSSMALLPSLGVPVLTFLLTAGPIFGERLGMTTVVLLSLAAITTNFLLTYLVARFVIRGFLERSFARFGYRIPSVANGDSTDLAIIIRVTPGIPFFVQNYLLGLAGIPIAKYLLISAVFNWSYSAAFVLFGDALQNGRGRVALVAASLAVAAIAGTHWARRRYAKKVKTE